MIHISFSFAGVSEKATCPLVDALEWHKKLANLGEQECWGEQGYIDNVQLSLSRLIGDPRDREDVPSQT